MPLSRSARMFYYRCTLAMAWVAMCLLFAGPVISQFQAAPHPQDSHSAHTGHHHHLVSAIDPLGHSHDTASEPTAFGALANWHTQCGYCELWQHSPSLSTALPAIAQGALVTSDDVTPAPHIGAVFHYNYPHSLTRGPPSLSSAH
ncbi:DUF2946 domain-containing protein [Halomonas aquamarina]|uniref:DUF2946 domain-containing protein n=1 Tax=Vreelandella aquamarina TaxID=77097 RepID=A0ACC5VT98_9GAMM|nr:DUF2946 domain-containing protein [Halomonas aquamarina]